MDPERDQLIRSSQNDIAVLRALISAAKATIERTRGLLQRLGGDDRSPSSG